MNLIFTYTEARAAMLADDWRVLAVCIDGVVWAKGDARALLHTSAIGNTEIVIACEGIEFARLIDQPNDKGFCKLKTIATQPGWIAHKPEPKKEPLNDNAIL